MTAGEEAAGRGRTLPPSLLHPPAEPGAWVLPGCLSPCPPRVSPHLHKARCSSGCGSGGSGTGWSGSAGTATGVTAPAGISLPRPQHPWVPCPHPHPPPTSPGPSPGGWCSSGCTSAPAHPSKASGAALSPSLRRSQGAAVTPGQGAPRGEVGTHMPQTGTATPGAPALRPNLGNPLEVGAAAFGAWKTSGFPIPRRIDKPRAGWAEAGARGKDAGCCPLPRGSSGRHDAHAGSGTGAQAGPGSAGSLLPEYPKEILEMGLR